MELTSWHHFFARCFTYYTIISFTQGIPLIGQKVRDANPNEFPFVVSIGRMRPVNIEERLSCTGTLISASKVLTAAHCLFRERPQIIEIMIGSASLSRSKRYRPLSWKSFDMWKYNKTKIEPSLNDIAIITLTESVDLPNVTPATVHASTPKYNSKARIAGWGGIEKGFASTVLKTAELQITSKEECESSIGTVANDVFYVPDNYFCSSADPWILSSCGDSGAPILNRKNQLIGINSGVCPNLAKYNCALEFPNQRKRNLHLRLDPFVKFIDSLIEKIIVEKLLK